jgi:hypothetical protein
VRYDEDVGVSSRYASVTLVALGVIAYNNVPAGLVEIIIGVASVIILPGGSRAAPERIDVVLLPWAQYALSAYLARDYYLTPLVIGAVFSVYRRGSRGTAESRVDDSKPLSELYDDALCWRCGSPVPSRLYLHYPAASYKLGPQRVYGRY